MKKTMLVLAACIIMSGCGVFAPGAPYLVFDREAFRNARADWQWHGLASYTFEASEFRGVPGPFFRMTVTEGEITDIELVGEWDWWSGEQHQADDFDRIRRVGTIPAVFDRIEALRREAVEQLDRLPDGTRVSLDVKYDERHGFPREVTSSTSGHDGYYHLVLRNFQPLN